MKLPATTGLSALTLSCLALAYACSDKPSETPTPGTAGSMSTGQSGGGNSATGGSAPGSSGTGPAPGAAGTTVVPQGGATAGGAPNGGSAGSAVSGGNGGSPGGGTDAGGSGGSSDNGGSGGLEPGDTPPARALNVTASMGEHRHGNAGLDTRATPLGKLVVDIGVNSGGYSAFLAKRGYHSMGAPCGGCPAPNLGAGRDAVGECRLGEFKNTEDHVKSTLASLQQQFPEEDWGYFLNEDGSVRWSDVALTGMSHGATTAAVAGRVAVRLWRVVSRSGPRDNGCGAAGGVCKLPLTTPSYDTACEPADIASWLDVESKTPMNRFYGMVGTTDVECGDIMFNMNYTKYPGMPVIWNEAGAVLTGTNQFFSTEGGHLDWLQAANLPTNTEEVLEIAFGVPVANRHPNF